MTARLRRSDRAARRRRGRALRGPGDRRHPARRRRAAAGLRPAGRRATATSASRSRPISALDTEGTIAEARRLWQAVDRPNLMIKVPGTKAGVPAIRPLIGEGINVNVTLLFSRGGLSRGGRGAHGRPGGAEGRRRRHLARCTASPASSSAASTARSTRRSTQRLAAGDAESDALERLRGKVAIANAKDRLPALSRAGREPALEGAGRRRARAPQRLLWASTGTKDPAYSDVLYVETLIGPDTVNTMPPKTMDAFRDHGAARQTPDRGCGRRAATCWPRPSASGLDLTASPSTLVDDGVAKFSEAVRQPAGGGGPPRAEVLGDRLNGQRRQPAGRSASGGGQDPERAPPPRAGAAACGARTRACGRRTRPKWLGWLDAARRRAAST